MSGTETVDINVLLLGETGVGKSTFINCIANYLTYETFERAEEEELLVLIPTIFHVRDKNGERHLINVGAKDKNEFLETGVSATQDVKTYAFPILNGRAKIRFIDTPGMGDTRGIEQDSVNSENILNYIAQLNELHAICFIFRPNQARNTVFFQYCMAQIMSRLDKSASKNIIFIYTNSRGSDYGPGDTMALLEKVVEDIRNRPPHAEIPLDRNVFCFDNEAFRYLAAVQNNVEFDTNIRRRNKESWDASSEQCWKLSRYILGDDVNPPLTPHLIKSTNAINEARRMIIQLSKPLAEISQLIGQNVNVLQRHEANLRLGNHTIDELRQKLYMPVINLEVMELSQPVTVCTSSTCAEIYKVGEASSWHYKTRCHEPCHLKTVPKEIIGSPELLGCAAINSSTRKCIKCSCDFSLHMHVYYMTKTKEDQIVDSNVEQNINDKEKMLQKTKKLIEQISNKKEELDSEHQIIITCTARFAHFLQNNAITPFNDAYKEYIEYLINREKSLGKLCDKQTVCHLEKLLREYEETKQSFDELLKSNQKRGRSEVAVSPNEIQDSIQQLYQLKHTGQKIKELYECQQFSRSREHENEEYVHKVQKSKKNTAKKGAECATKEKNTSTDKSKTGNSSTKKDNPSKPNKDMVKSKSGSVNRQGKSAPKKMVTSKKDTGLISSLWNWNTRNKGTAKAKVKISKSSQSDTEDSDTSVTSQKH